MEQTLPAGQLGLLFFILAITLGALTRFGLKRFTAIPYTVALLIEGLALGLLAHRVVDIHTPIIDAIHLASKIDPHFVLFIFIPALIFEAAFSMDPYVFRRSLRNILLLAIPGFLIATGLTGALAKFLPYDWSWPIALMFGALISATDPVAVVALLKDLGAGKKLSTTIEGESLLNDGVAIVAFMVFFKLAGHHGAHQSVLDVVSNFGVVAIGGILIGLGCAWATISFIRRVFNDGLVEITATIAAAYITFFVAESIHVSGILAVVAFGLMLAGIGRTRISPEVETFLHRFWEMVAYIANTLIFLIVGIVIGSHADFGSNLDFGWLLLMYAGIHIARGITIAMFSPFIQGDICGLSKKEQVIVWWGGLRGAIGLALALIVAQDPSISAKVSGEILFLTSGIVVMTLLFNGVSMQKLVHWLKLDQPSAAKSKMLETAAAHLATSQAKELNLLKANPVFSQADWRRVAAFLPSYSGWRPKSGPILSQDIIKEGRRLVLQAERASYWRQFEDGFLGPDLVRHLIESTKVSLDRGDSLAHRPELQALWEFPGLFQSLSTWPVIGHCLRPWIAERLVQGYDALTGYICAYDDTRKAIDTLADSTIEKIVREEVYASYTHALSKLSEMRETFPEIARAIATKTASRSILNYQRRLVEDLQEAGLLEEPEGLQLVETIESAIKRLNDIPPKVELPSIDQLLSQTHWLEGLPKDGLDAVKQIVQETVYNKGEVLVKQGDTSQEIFIIARGTVCVEIDNTVVCHLGPGSIVGEISLLTQLPRAGTVIAQSDVLILKLNGPDLLTILDRYPEEKEKLWHTAGLRLAENCLSAILPYANWPRPRLQRWLSARHIEKAGPKISLTISEGTLLLHGSVQTQSGDMITGPIQLPETGMTTIDACILYRCPPKGSPIDL